MRMENVPDTLLRQAERSAWQREMRQVVMKVVGGGNDRKKTQSDHPGVGSEDATQRGV
jgi:hypothetical protein